MKLTIKDAAKFKLLIEKMSKSLEYVAIIFARDKVVISGMDEGNIVAAKLVIPRDKLSDYDYMPTENIGINLTSLMTILDEMAGDVTLLVEEDKLLVSAKNKEFKLPIMRLGSHGDALQLKSAVRWNINGKIEGIEKVYMQTADKGGQPLIISSTPDGYSLTWVFAPIIQSG